MSMCMCMTHIQSYRWERQAQQSARETRRDRSADRRQSTSDPRRATADPRETGLRDYGARKRCEERERRDLNAGSYGTTREERSKIDRDFFTKRFGGPRVTPIAALRGEWSVSRTRREHFRTQPVLGHISGLAWSCRVRLPCRRRTRAQSTETAARLPATAAYARCPTT